MNASLARYRVRTLDAQGNRWARDCASRDEAIRAKAAIELDAELSDSPVERVEITKRRTA